MFLLEILSFLIKTAVIVAILYCLQVAILLFICTINFTKKIIILIFINKISHITIYPAKKKYKREAIETGYSIHACGISQHYRYYDVYRGSYRDVDIVFDYGFKVRVNLNEEGVLYKKLLEI